jgi:hypothetical protein
LENNDAKIHIFLEPTRKNGNKSFYTISLQTSVSSVSICNLLNMNQLQEEQMGADGNSMNHAGV